MAVDQSVNTAHTLKQQRLYRLKLSFIACWVMMFGLFAVDYLFDAEHSVHSVSRSRRLVADDGGDEDAAAKEWNQKIADEIGKESPSLQETIFNTKGAIDENEGTFKEILDKYITAKRQVKIATGSIQQLKEKKALRTEVFNVINKGSKAEHSGINKEGKTGVELQGDTKELEADLERNVIDVGNELNDISKKITETEKYLAEQQKAVDIYHKQMNAIIKKDNNERDIEAALEKLVEHAHHTSTAWDQGATFAIDDKAAGMQHGTRVHTVTGAPDVVYIEEIFEKPLEAECQFKIYIGNDGCGAAEGIEICDVGGEDDDACKNCERVNIDLQAVRKWTNGEDKKSKELSVKDGKRRRMKDEKEEEDDGKEKGGQMFCVITKVYLAKGEDKKDPKCELKGKMEFKPKNKDKPEVVHCADAVTEKSRKQGEEAGIQGKVPAEKEPKDLSAGWRSTYVGIYPYMVTALLLVITIISSMFFMIRD